VTQIADFEVVRIVAQAGMELAPILIERLSAKH
jgi:hypothetical protein